MKLKHIKNQSEVEFMRKMAEYNVKHQRYKRRQKRYNKQRHMVRSQNWQKTLDEFKHNIKKKGVGRIYKVKGKTLKTYWDTIDRLLD